MYQVQMHCSAFPKRVKGGGKVRHTIPSVKIREENLR